MKSFIYAIILCSTFSLATISCKKKESNLPPKATGKGTDSSNKIEYNDVDKKIISLYQNWKFGSQAYQHTKNILELGPRPIESEGHKKTQAYITSHLKQFGWIVSPQSFKAKTPYGERSFTNLIARRTDAKNSPNLVLAAHYDSKLISGTNFLGADDAASSVAALLEIAEHLPKHEKAITQQIELVFFDGEESLSPNIEYLKDGLYGSIYYSTYLRNDVAGAKNTYQATPKFGILLDMIGHRNLSIKIPGDTPYQLLKSYYKVIEKHDLTNRFSVITGHPQNPQGSILDDHYPMNKIADLPTMDLIGDFSAKGWWHTDKDNLENISENSLNISIQVALEIVKDQVSKMNTQ